MELDGIAQWYAVLQCSLRHPVQKAFREDVRYAMATRIRTDNLCVGRSVAACENTFNLLTNRVSSMLAPGPPFVPAKGSPALLPPKPKKKRVSSGVSVSGTNGPIQPSQYTFAPINQTDPPSAYQYQPSTPGDTPDKAGKKRGRPTKAEYEARAAEAAARGEAWPPPKRHKKPSGEGAAMMEGTEAGELGTGSTSKKKARKPKTAPTGPGASILGTEGQGGFALQLGASAGDRMQIDAPEGQVKSTIPETQYAESTAPESLIAEMHEHAAQAVTTIPETATTNTAVPPTQSETTQSSVTLPHDPPPGEQQQGQHTTVEGT